MFNKHDISRNTCQLFSGQSAAMTGGILLPAAICDLLSQSGFEVLKCADRLLETNNPGTTWFVIARKRHTDGTDH